MTIARILCLIVLLCFSTSCSTGSTGLPLIHSGPSDGALITLQAKDAKLSDVLIWIADQAGLTSDMRVPDDRITMDVQGAKLSDIMNDLCYAYQCEWKIDSGKLIVSDK